MTILEIKNLTLEKNGKKIIDDLSLNILVGHVHAIVGPNGAGKSTIAHTIMGLDGYTESKGEIIFEGKSIKSLNVQKRASEGITLAWQEPVRFQGLTVEQYLNASAKEKNEKLVRDALNKVGLNPDIYLCRALDKTLSGGERKRIELASIIVMQPKLVILDEPDSGIDMESIDKIFETITFLKKNNTTIILITHSLAVLKKAEYAFLLCEGKLINKGSAATIHKFFKNKCVICEHPNIPEMEGLE